MLYPFSYTECVKHFKRHTQVRETAGNEEKGSLMILLEIVNFLK
jgi:hypothetical protein